MGVKMVLSGEGADEIFGGYLYFHKAPNAKYDIQRHNGSMNEGLGGEARGRHKKTRME
jgi:asparagine synthetase B (glutamine-hydrolysing)